MMVHDELYKKIKLLLTSGLMWLFVFQTFLETMWEPFRYTDELVAVIGGIFLVKEIISKKTIHASKDTWTIACLLMLFLIAGLLGDCVHQYQPIKAVLIDLVANMKFYFAIIAGYYLFRNMSWEENKKNICINLKIITVVVFCLFVVDQLLDIYWGDIRYGMKSATLVFVHPTYLAGAMAFLIVMLTIFYEKNNLIYICMNAIVMAMTLRSKAFASVVVYLILFYVITTFRRKIKITDILLLGIICIIVAWPMINFYFISLSGLSARSIMLNTAFEIMGDYFPIGTGFGTYASDMAREYYSPVYVKYGFMETQELKAGSNFLIDSFWPIIMGQTGFIGSVAYIGVLFLLLKKILKLFEINKYIFSGTIYIIIYLMISSIAEPIFNNSIAIPLAVALGIAFSKKNYKNEGWSNETGTRIFNI